MSGQVGHRRRLRLTRPDLRADARAGAAHRRCHRGPDDLSRSRPSPATTPATRSSSSNQGGRDRRLRFSCHIEGGTTGAPGSLPSRARVGTEAALTSVVPSVLRTVAGTAPYHWDGSQTDLPTLYTNSLIRMSGPTLTTDQETAFASWLSSSSRDRPPSRSTPARSRAGSRSSRGPARAPPVTPDRSSPTTRRWTSAPGKHSRSPAHRCLPWRPPFLHDGCAATLSDAIGAQQRGDARRAAHRGADVRFHDVLGRASARPGQGEFWIVKIGGLRSAATCLPGRLITAARNVAAPARTARCSSERFTMT